MSELGTAIRIAAVSQESTLDKGGNPYILHSIAVMHGLGPEATHQEMAAGILHDVLEDDPAWTVDNLRKEGISEVVIQALVCLTHPVHEPYEDYIKRVATNRIALKVKMADLTNNMDPRRLKGLRQKDFERMQKYMRSYEYLKMVRDADRQVYA